MHACSVNNLTPWVFATGMLPLSQSRTESLGHSSTHIKARTGSWIKFFVRADDENLSGTSHIRKQRIVSGI
jgi:hypothetical protein